jgi:hypothetical protein
MSTLEYPRVPHAAPRLFARLVVQQLVQRQRHAFINACEQRAVGHDAPVPALQPGELRSAALQRGATWCAALQRGAPSVAFRLADSHAHSLQPVLSGRSHKKTTNELKHERQINKI